MLSTDSSKNIEKIPWIEKYRPASTDDIISHTEIITSLNRLIDMNTLPHMLFFGPSGTGKTSTIKCCATKLYGKYIGFMVLELNASNERGIETVRTKIKNFVTNNTSQYLPTEERQKFKLVILDEIDSMTAEAQGMLRQIIEKNSASTRFCLICNDIDKINIALQSRCALFCFKPLKNIEQRKKLIDICKNEKINYSKDAIDVIVKLSEGDLRSSINILQHVNLTVDNKIKIDNIYGILGCPSPEINETIFKNLMKLHNERKTLSETVENIGNIMSENNVTISNMLDELKNIILTSSFSTNRKLYIIDKLADIEIYDSVNADPRIIVMLISSVFVLIRSID